MNTFIDFLLVYFAFFLSKEYVKFHREVLTAWSCLEFKKKFKCFLFSAVSTSLSFYLELRNIITVSPFIIFTPFIKPSVMLA